MHKGFDHDRFASICDKYKCPQLISYNAFQPVAIVLKGEWIEFSTLTR